jgi:hypothetical protein
MATKKTKGMTKEEFEELDFKLHMAFVNAHRLADPEELEALLDKVGIDYLHEWKFKALIEWKGITSQKQWEKFLRDNPVIPTY